MCEFKGLHNFVKYRFITCLCAIIVCECSGWGINFLDLPGGWGIDILEIKIPQIPRGCTGGEGW